MKKRSGAVCPTPRFTGNLEPIVAGWSSDNLVLIASIAWLLFYVVGQPAEQFEHLSGPNFSEFNRIDSGEEVAELQCERKHGLIQC